MLGFALLLTGCTPSVVEGTYQLKTTSNDHGQTWGTVRLPLRAESITLRQDGSFSVNRNTMFDSWVKGTYRVEGTNLVFSVGGQRITAELQDNIITLQESGGPVEYRKGVINWALILVVAVVLWLAIVGIQEMLAYGLAARNKESHESGVSLYFDLVALRFLSLIPGLVIAIWLSERKRRQ